MRSYYITAYVSSGTQTKIIEAKNQSEAYYKALDFGHKLTNYGNKGFFSGVSVKPVKNQKKYKGR